MTHPSKRTFTNYKKADWTAFRDNIDRELTDFEIDSFPSIDAAAKHLTDTIIKYSKLHIPTGAVKHFFPGFNRNIRLKTRIRNRLRNQTPTPSIINRIQALNDEIAEATAQEERTQWRQLLGSITFNPLVPKRSSEKNIINVFYFSNLL